MVRFTKISPPTTQCVRKCPKQDLRQVPSTSCSEKEKYGKEEIVGENDVNSIFAVQPLFHKLPLNTGHAHRKSSTSRTVHCWRTLEWFQISSAVISPTGGLPLVCKDAATAILPNQSRRERERRSVSMRGPWQICGSCAYAVSSRYLPWTKTGAIRWNSPLPSVGAMGG